MITLSEADRNMSNTRLAEKYGCSHRTINNARNRQKLFRTAAGVEGAPSCFSLYFPARDLARLEELAREHGTSAARLIKKMARELLRTGEAVL
ncbi:MAG: hypothetical protein Q4F72_02810 [Desulfovibrionaceae bacterium]|nr:hypothetical protein [Desulfovibrionaceae bacterium]